MHGFGHDKGHKVFTWSHDSRDQSWVAQNTRWEARGAVATQEPGPPQLSFGGLGLKLEKEDPSGPGSGNLRQAIGAAEHISSQQ